MLAWLGRVWKWIAGVASAIVVLVLLGLSWKYCFDSLRHGNEETRTAVNGVNGSINGLRTNVETLNTSVEEGTKVAKATGESVDKLPGRIAEELKKVWPTGPSPAGTPGGMPPGGVAPSAFAPTAATSELLVSLSDSDRDVAAGAAAQVILLGRQGDAEVLEGLALAYNSGGSRMKARVKWCLDQVGEPAKAWQRNTLANPGADPRLRVAIERLTSYEASNEAQIARLQVQQSQAQKKLAEAQKAWASGRTEDQEVLADHSKKLDWLNNKVKALERARAQSQLRPQPQPTPAPAPAPAATSAIVPTADPPVKTVYYNGRTPVYQTFQRAPTVRRVIRPCTILGNW